MYTPVFPEITKINTERLLDRIDESGMDNHSSNSILDLIRGTDFLEAPASTKYHGAYPVGLFDHSMAVANQLIKFTLAGVTDSWKRPFSPFYCWYLA